MLRYAELPARGRHDAAFALSLFSWPAADASHFQLRHADGCAPQQIISIFITADY